MVFMIFYKWCVDWSSRDFPAPSLITCLISMLLAMGHVDADSTKNQLFTNPQTQNTLQIVVVLCAVISIPCMLFPKPILLFYQHRAYTQTHTTCIGNLPLETFHCDWSCVVDEEVGHGSDVLLHVSSAQTNAQTDHSKSNQQHVCPLIQKMG